MPAWGDAEFQQALHDKSIEFRRTSIQFAESRESVSQYYLMSQPDEVKCCIVPADVVRVVGKPHERIGTLRGEHILVWPDHHADVYNRQDRFVSRVGQLQFDAAVWRELFGDTHNPQDPGPPAAPLPPATPDDIFADLRDLLQNMPDTPENQAMHASLDREKEHFDDFCEIGPLNEFEPEAYQYNARTAYQSIGEFIEKIEPHLADPATRVNAAYIEQFCHRMCTEVLSVEDPTYEVTRYDPTTKSDQTYKDNYRILRSIEKQLQTYYTGPPACPTSLILAKHRRIAENL
jgi:hypothetical protein